MATKSNGQGTILVGGVFEQMDFTEFSGGELSRDAEDYPKGLTDEKGYVAGILKYGDITVRAPYDPQVHNGVTRKFLNYCGEPIDIVVQFYSVCPERQPDGEPQTYLNCMPIYCKPCPDVNRGEGGVARYEMRFKVGGYRLG
jgi:hypothetical protein